MPPGGGRAELAALRYEVDELKSMLISVPELLQQVAESHQRLAGQARQVQVAIDDVLQLVMRHETDIAGWLADRTAERSDLDSERHRQQQDVWQRFDAFVGRQVEQVVNDILRATIASTTQSSKPSGSARWCGCCSRRHGGGRPRRVRRRRTPADRRPEAPRRLLGEAADVGQAAADLGVVLGRIARALDTVLTARVAPGTGAA